MIPKKWGQGQLFAFSAIDGESLFSDDFAGILTGDRVGITFFSSVKRTLFFENITTEMNPAWKAVTSDLIILDTLSGPASMIYIDKHLVIGEIPKDVYFSAEICGRANIIIKGDIEIHDTLDGDFTALCKRQNRFSFAYGNTAEEAEKLCKKGFESDIEKVKKSKLEIYEKHSLSNEEYSELYGKCLSVMKSQLYSADGNIKRMWSTPDRLPHRNMWLWDSVFHAIGHRHIDSHRAESLILALFDVQQSDGFIPHMAKPDFISKITQPPVIGWGAFLVYEKSGNRDFLKTVFENNRKFLLWCRQNRRKSEKELYSWHTNPEENNRCDESGMDNSPRFDTESDLFAIDFSCYMANEVKYMKKIAEILSDKEGYEFFDNWHKKITDDINEKLWCEEDGFYYDYDINNNCFSKVQSVASFLPLFAEICDFKKAERLIKHLENPDEFGTEFPVPSISKKDKSFGTDMWRGPVWINYNYMIAKGLRDYGYSMLSEKIRTKTIDTINLWYKRTGTVYEFYDSENSIPPSCFNRKGQIFEPYDFRVKYQSIRDYGWTATLVFDLLNEMS